MLDSQTSDEVFKVVNDFHQKNHRMIADRESMDEGHSRSSSYDVGPEYTDDDDEAIDLFVENELVEPYNQPEWQARKYQQMKGSSSNVVTLSRPHHAYYAGGGGGSHEGITYYNLPKKNPNGKQRGGDGHGLIVLH